MSYTFDLIFGKSVMGPASPSAFASEPRRQPVIKLTDSVECNRANLLVHLRIDTEQHQSLQYETVGRTLNLAFRAGSLP